MPPIVPETESGRLHFYETHIPIWAAAPPATLGLSAAQVSDLNDLTLAARAAYTAAQQARDAARAATLELHLRLAAMHDLGSDLIETIKAFSQVNDDVDVLIAAQIPARAPRRPAPPPQPPSDIRLSMLSNGSVELSWKGSTARGQFFTLWRLLPDTDLPPTHRTSPTSPTSPTHPTPPTQIAALAGNRFLDSTLPRGLTQATYFLRAHRGTRVSEPSGNATIYFGTIPSPASTSAPSATHLPAPLPVRAVHSAA